ncbi:nucleotidyltransferase domain-containing protein [Candidatus Woesearchaeota archaeon]|nr:nucleotidyltransferase domain-containing protein [Candidatus Woesearchaeota archaeon]
MEISRKIKLAHTSVKKAITELAKEGMITEQIEKKGRRNFPIYKANINNACFKEKKRIYNLQKITESGLIEHIEEKLTPKSIVMFGSYQRGEDLEDSDIDLFIECPETEVDIKQYEKKLKRKIQLHFNKDFTRYPVELKNNIVNGTILKGYLEAFK